jgi:molybdopterin-guanine dinucleotide biosynthesis protein A
MAKYSNITLAILAGGKASRMGGRNKALLEIEGETFISRIHRNLGPLFQHTIIISNDVKDFGIPEVIVYSDIIENTGPLGGIHSSLVNSFHPFVFIVSCDMPFVDAGIAKTLSEEFIGKQPDIIVPVINAYNEPLFAIYSKLLVDKIEAIVSPSNGRPIRDLLRIANTFFFDLPDNSVTKRCFTNINALDDLEKI